MTEPSALRHVVITVDPGQLVSGSRLALTVRDGGDSGVITGAAGPDVVVHAGEPPSGADFGDAVLACQVSSGQVRCQVVTGGQAGREVETTALTAADIFDRNRGIFETSLLKDSGVAILGLGSGGSFVAGELAKAGVGRFLLLDHDRLEVSNVARHECGLSDVGRLKVNAMRDHLRNRNPAVEIRTSPLHFDGTTRAHVRELLAEFGPDLVIGGTDTRESRLMINRMCLSAGYPLILGGVHHRAYGGLVQRVIPGLTACYQCFVSGLPSLASDNEVSSAANAQAIAYSDRPVEPQPGLSSDILPIALLMVKLALLELVGNRSPAFISLHEDLVAPLYQWTNRREADSGAAGMRPMGIGVDEPSILRWYGIMLARRNTCPTCGNQFAGAEAVAEADLAEDPVSSPSP